jgi:hypothetical protein
VLLALAAPGSAAAETGTATIAGRSVLAVDGCGRDRAAFAVTLVTEPDGTWRAQDGDGRPFTGTWTVRSASGRKLDVAFAPATEAAFVEGLATDVAVLCKTPDVVVRSVARKTVTLALNRRRTRATLVLRYTLRGSAGGGAGSARYRAKATGAWTARTAPGDALAVTRAR